MTVSPSVLQAHVSTWAARLAPNNRWVPHFGYHFTDVKNAASILDDGELLSRNASEAAGKMMQDNASPQVIAQSSSDCHGYVRLYFRPLTPTQYRNEGIRTPGEIWQGAHCPVPVFFLFSFPALGRMLDTKFSDGSMAARRVTVGNDDKFFATIPFDKVFHKGPYPPHEGTEIKFRRHAEILIPDRLDLSSLQRIFVRSNPERETLLRLCSPAARKWWSSKIFVTVANFFNASWTFVQSVDASPHRVRFALSRNVPVRARFEGLDQNGRKHTWPNQGSNNADGMIRDTLPLTINKGAEDLDVKLYIEDCLAYAGRLYVGDDEIPFSGVFAAIAAAPALDATAAALPR